MAFTWMEQFTSSTDVIPQRLVIAIQLVYSAYLQTVCCTSILLLLFFTITCCLNRHVLGLWQFCTKCYHRKVMFYNLEVSEYYVYLIIWPRHCIFKWQTHKAPFTNQTSFLILLGRLNAPKSVTITDARITKITIIYICSILWNFMSEIILWFSIYPALHNI